MKVMLLGDGEVEPNVDQILQLAVEICKEDVISLFFHNLSILGWEVSDYDLIPSSYVLSYDILMSMMTL